MSPLWLRPRAPWSALRLVALAAVICLVAGTSVPAADSRGGGAVATSAKRDCASDLAEANGFLKQVLALRADAKKGKFFLVPSAHPSRFYPIHVDAYTSMLILELFAGKITRSELKQQIKFLSRYRAATIKALNEMVKDSLKERNEIAEKCAEGAKPKPNPPPAEGAFPGGTATTMTFTVGGVTVTTDLKTNKQDSDPTVKGSSPSSLDGKVELNGTLPAGWTVVVFHNGGADIILNSATGGSFNLKPISTAFDAMTRPSAYVCSTAVPPLCSPSAQSSISVDWDP